MKKYQKLIIYPLFYLLVLLIGAVIAMDSWLDTENSKQRLSETISDKIGRPFEIKGHVKLSFYPSLGVNLSQLHVGNPPQFKQKEFASLDKAIVSARLLPLLRKEISVNRIHVKGLSLHLITNQDNENNWDGLADNHGTQASPPPQPTPTTAAKTSQVPPISISISDLRVSDSTVNIQNEKTGERQSLILESLRSSNITLGSSFPLSVSLRLKQQDLSDTTSLTANILIDLANKHYELQSLKINNVLSSTKLPKGKIHSELQGQFALNQVDETLKLSDLRVVLDSSTLTGQFSLEQFNAPKVRFNFSADKINADDYLPLIQSKQQITPSTTPVTTSNTSSAVVATTSATSTTVPSTSNTHSFAQVRNLDVAGSLSIGEIIAYNLHTEDLNIRLHGKGGLLRISPATAKFYQGEISADNTIDFRGHHLKYKKSIAMTGIQLGPLMKDLSGSALLTGVATITMDVQGTGVDPEVVKRNIRGTATLDLKDGKIRGIDVAQQLRFAQSLVEAIKAGTPPPQLEKLNAPQTAFEKITGTATIANGIVQNDDLLLVAPHLQVKGKGQFSLLDNTVDYHIAVRSDKAEDVEFPMHITGTAKQLKIQLDQDALQKFAEAQLKKKAENSLKKKVSDTLEEKFGIDGKELLNKLKF